MPLSSVLPVKSVPMCNRFLALSFCRIALLLSFSLVSISTLAQEDRYWLNTWDEACYVDGINTCREEWYTTTQGSHLLMWEVFVALEQEDSFKAFSGQDNLSSYGFLYPNASYKDSSELGYEAVNSYTSTAAMPLGVLSDRSQIDNRNYMGLTCAGCHTGEVTFGDERYYIEAGQARLDMTGFFNGLVAALEANSTGRKLSRFKRRFMLNEFFNINNSYVYVDPFAGEAYLKEALESVRGFVEREAGVVANGPGRLDAIGSIINQVLVHQAGLDANGESEVRPLSAPISYPYIWDASRLECVQTNCISNNPLTRNIGEVLGVFGSVNIDDDENIPDLWELAFYELGINNLFENSAQIDNMYRLEKVLGYIDSPRWPESFPALDQNLVATGKVVYQVECAGCHMDVSDGIDDSELTAPNSVGYQYTKVTKVPFTEVGTDPSFVLDYGLRSEPSGILGAALSAQRPEEFPEAPETLNALALTGVATGAIVSSHFESEAFAQRAIAAFPDLPEEVAIQYLQVEYVEGQVDSQVFNPAVYRAKPLNGVAFTGPFLHNGSVRTLTDLLKAPADRPTSFYVGSTEFDAQNVGYVNEGEFLFDATIRGNSNAGHSYGVELSASDKVALIEYIKSM